MWGWGHTEPILFSQQSYLQPRMGVWGQVGTDQERCWCVARPGAAPAGAPNSLTHPSLSAEKPSAFSQGLMDATVTEGEDLTLVCETSASDSPVCWTKDGKPLRPSARCQLTYEGRRAQLVITETTLQDSGRYKCETAGAWSSSIVRVHGEPWGSGAGQPPATFLTLSPCPGPGRLRDALCPLRVWVQRIQGSFGPLFVALTLPAGCPVSGFLLLLKASLSLSWSSDQQSFFFLTSLLTLCVLTLPRLPSLGLAHLRLSWLGLATKCHRLGGLKDRHLLSPRFGDQKSEIKVL